MKSLVVHASAWFFVAALLVATVRTVDGAELSIPCGYFNQSGGFHDVGCGPHACPRFGAAGGCTIPLDFRAAAQSAFPRTPFDAAAVSWYAGEVGPCAVGQAELDSGYSPTTVESKSGAGWEDVGPGLPIEQP